LGAWGGFEIAGDSGDAEDVAVVVIASMILLPCRASLRHGNTPRLDLQSP
jgi:hypothetical protein